MASTSASAGAQARWELENNVQLQPAVDNLLRYDPKLQEDLRTQKPWKADPNYFKQCVASNAVLRHRPASSRPYSLHSLPWYAV